MPNILNKLVTKSHHIFKDNDGIIHVEIIEGAHICLQSIKESGKYIHSYAGNRKELVIVDARKHHTITDEAMSFLKTEMIEKNRLATAVVTDKLGIRIMIDYFTKFLKSKAKVRIFTSEEEALKWLLGFRIRNKKKMA